jgi:hypothetical protein
MSNLQITLSRVQVYRCSQESPAPNAWISWRIATESQVIELFRRNRLPSQPINPCEYCMLLLLHIGVV